MIKVRRIRSTRQARTARVIALRRKEDRLWYKEQGELYRARRGDETVSRNVWRARRASSFYGEYVEPEHPLYPLAVKITYMPGLSIQNSHDVMDAVQQWAIHNDLKGRS